jgi:hypothetical protein
MLLGFSVSRFRLKKAPERKQGWKSPQFTTPVVNSLRTILYGIVTVMNPI